MRFATNLLMLRDSLHMLVPCPLAEVVSGMTTQIEPRRFFRWFAVSGYEGEISDQGFKIRRLGGPRDGKRSVVVRGSFSPEGENTHVYVTLRHRILFRCFSWLFFPIAALAGVSALFQAAQGAPVEQAWGGVAVLAIWWLIHYRFWSNVQRVKKEVGAMISAAAAGICPESSVSRLAS